MTVLEIEGLRFERESFRLELSLSLAEGERGMVLGASGSGKTSLLRLIAGFLEPAAGSIRKRGRELRGLPPERRGIGMVFQEDALFPTMRAGQNIEYGLRLAKLGREERKRRVAELAEAMGIGALLGRLPRELSGGERQRVALARTLAVEPELVLFDEALASLDPRNAERIEETFAALAAARGLTSLHVSHNVDEALARADRIFLIEGGSLVEEGRPEELYERPAHEATARWFGSGPLLPLGSGGGAAELLRGAERRGTRARGAEGGVPRFAHFPSVLADIAEEGALPAACLGLPVLVEGLSYHGSRRAAELRIEGTELRFRRDFGGSRPLRPGQRLLLAVPEDSVALLLP